MAFTESDWAAYVPLTIDNTKVAATMPDGGESGFPAVLVIENAGDNWEGDAANIFAKVVSYANDIAVTLNDGSTQLKHDIVEYNGTGGSELLVCHILVPSVAGATDTVVRLYYRDDGAADQQQTVYLAADNWQGYWSLHESAAGTGTADVYKDLSDNANHGDDYVSDAGKAGQVGLGQEFDNSDDYISIPDHASLNSTVCTVGAWVKINDTSDGCIIYTQQTDDYSKGWLLHTFGGVGQIIGPILESRGIAIPDTNWHHWVGRGAGTSGTEIKLLLDGGASTSGGTADGSFTPAGHDKWIGRSSHLGRTMNGNIDELWVCDAVRSDNWITTLYNSQDDNDAFWTVGAETAVSASYAHADGGLAIFLGGETEAVVARLADGGLAIFGGGETEALSAIVANGGEAIFMGGAAALETFLRLYLEGYPVIKLLEGKPVDKLLEGYPVMPKFGGKPTS